MNVVPLRVGNTLWVYAPQPRLLHPEFGKNPDKIFDEAMIDKARNILTSISRVCLSAEKAPEFFVLVLSDINLGLDYSLTANIMDIKRSAAGGVPWNEANKRYVIGFEQEPKAIGDAKGEHLKVYSIRMRDFLSKQIGQRVRMFFQEEPVKRCFTLKEVDAGFQEDKFILQYTTERISGAKEKINIQREIVFIITYCFKTYGFNDFSRVEIRDLSEGQSSLYDKKDILSRSIE